MKTKGKLAASALCLVAAVGLMAACAPQGSESTQGADKPAPITADDLGRIGNDIGYADDGARTSRTTPNTPRS